MFSLLTMIICSYLVGSIPTAIIISRIGLKDDIRKHGSGNAGATNVYRVMGWKPALFVVLVDIGKGLIASLILPQIQIDYISLDMNLIRLITGMFAILGHIWTVFAGFKGGKGVGTAFGVLLGILPIAASMTFIVWLIIVLTVRIVSVGSIAAAMIFPILIFIEKRFVHSELPNGFIVLSIFLTALILVTHRSNIRRLLRGEENRFGSQKNQYGKRI